MNLDLFSRSLLSNVSTAYTALQGNLAATQNANDTISKLVDRLDNAPLMEDRRASLLSLKALARDWKADVAKQGLPSLLTVLKVDASRDIETAKACLETLITLCETDEPAEVEGQPRAPLPKNHQDLGLLHTDIFLQSAEPLHLLLTLLSTNHFYLRFFTLQLLSTLLQNRPPKVQEYVLTSPGGVRPVMECLEEKREILRNEALLLLHNLTVSNADLQKIVAFDGAFELLLDIVFQEGGIEGGIVVQDCLAAVGSLLKYNTSNQNYFRELSQIPRLPPLLLFPSPPPHPSHPPPDEFALQYWPTQKITNAGLVIGLVRLLLSSPNAPKDNQAAMLSSGMTRCLVELAMSSNAPPVLKAQALNTLACVLRNSPSNQKLMLELQTAPLLPLPPDDPEMNPDQGVGYTRLSVRPAMGVLMSLAVHGEHPVGSIESEEGWRGMGLKVRKAAVGCFECLVGGPDKEVGEGLVASMKAGVPMPNPNDEGEVPPSPGALLLSALTDYPTSGPTYDPYRPIFASLLFAHLIRSSEIAKKLAREIVFPSSSASDDAAAPPDGEEDEEEPIGLVQVVVGNLMMAFREQVDLANRLARGDGGEGEGEGRREMTGADWSRAMVGWLIVLCTWLWDSPGTVREFLSEGANLQIIIEPILLPPSSPSADPLLQGLSAFLLGVCYEFNREPGEITRSTLYPILHGRIGPDTFVSRMAGLREDERFKVVGPETGEFDLPVDEEEDGNGADGDGVAKEEKRRERAAREREEEELGNWFDWTFVEFWKNNYYTIQRSINADPESSTRSADADTESASLIASLRSRMKAQSEELEDLQNKLRGLMAEKEIATTLSDSTTSELTTLRSDLSTAQSSIISLESQLFTLQATLSSTQAELSSLQSTHSTLTTTHTELEAVHAAIKGECEGMRGELESLGGESGVLQRANQELQSSFKTLQTSHTELQTKHDDLSSSSNATAVEASRREALEAQLESMRGELEAARRKHGEDEKEHEDLLILLEDLSAKRRRDKVRMRDGGIEGVSEDEEDDDDDDDDEEEEEEGNENGEEDK